MLRLSTQIAGSFLGGALRSSSEAIAGRVPPLTFCHRRGFASASAKQLDDQTKDRIDGYVKANDVVVFMKGTKEQPMCGFSMSVKRVLDVHAVDFKDYNVLEDEKLREGVKIYSDWPTIPQVYVKGEFIGGSDILIQLHKDGEITDLFDKSGVPSKFSDVLPAKKEETTN